MAKGSRYQIVGTEHPVSQSPAVASPSANPKSGTWQLVGDSKQMSQKSIQSPSANPRSGAWQLVGDEAKMSRTPVKGWGNAASLVMSERAITQSHTAAGGGGKKRK